MKIANKLITMKLRKPTNLVAPVVLLLPVLLPGLGDGPGDGPGPGVEFEPLVPLGFGGLVELLVFVGVGVGPGPGFGPGVLLFVHTVAVAGVNGFGS